MLFSGNKIHSFYFTKINYLFLLNENAIKKNTKTVAVKNTNFGKAFINSSIEKISKTKKLIDNKAIKEIVKINTLIKLFILFIYKLFLFKLYP